MKALTAHGFTLTWAKWDITPTSSNVRVLIWHIQRGHYGNINLDGLSFVRVGRWEGDLWAGKAKGTAGIFIDERANDQQAEVLPRIFGGHVGGFPTLVAALFAEGRQVRGVERAQIILI